MLGRIGIEALAPDRDVVRIVGEARHRLPLNFGDCFAYAHAKLLGVPLLTLDSDFLKTDLAAVLHPDA
ncbi:MAG: type II toxin-antitoxin system VapC family toxin [Rhodospirillaceae bacterium]